jgi:hypothetical protein
MPYLGSEPAQAALSSADLADNIITQAKMADDAIALAELKAGTDGELISWDASGNPTAIGAGTSGHYLKSQGAGSQPVFAVVEGAYDLQGAELTLDANANTSITADTDDQIDFEIAGADDFQMTANTFTALSGSTIATNTIAETTGASGVTIDGVIIKDTTVDLGGTADALILDANGNTTISSPTDDQIDFEIAGADDFTMTANTFTALSGSTVAIAAGGAITNAGTMAPDISSTGKAMVLGF